MNVINEFSNKERDLLNKLGEKDKKINELMGQLKLKEDLLNANNNDLSIKIWQLSQMI